MRRRESTHNPKETPSGLEQKAPHRRKDNQAKEKEKTATDKHTRIYKTNPKTHIKRRTTPTPSPSSSPTTATTTYNNNKHNRRKYRHTTTKFRIHQITHNKNNTKHRDSR
jgi:hypothetical protein